jgi:diadenosine tetraphosphatase ApaH/serine/threonine PP2A family protein phosphatase
MRYALISDIHGNLQALTAVLKALDNCRIDQYLCLGDIVGYGANPNECVRLVRNLTGETVAGNHDYAAVGLTHISNFNAHASEAVRWTARHLSEENKQYLRALPLWLKMGSYNLVHSTPPRPELWDYILSPYDALTAFSYFEDSICFVAHSHRSMTFIQGPGGLQWDFSNRIQILSDSRYIINTGSIGQPRDRDPRACFALLDTEASEVRIQRVGYDISEAQAAIRTAGLPEILADRLQYGE